MELGGPAGGTWAYLRAGPAWARQEMDGRRPDPREPMLLKFAMGAWAAEADHRPGIRRPGGKQTARVKLGNFRPCLAFLRGASQPAPSNSSFRNDRFVLAAFLFVEWSLVEFARGSPPQNRA